MEVKLQPDDVVSGNQLVSGEVKWGNGVTNLIPLLGHRSTIERKDW